MEPIRDDSNTSRPHWEIDRLLARLVGRMIRVGAEWFSPVRWDGRSLPEFVRVADLILPDNSRPGPLPAFFEGRLRQFDRRIGVVFVTLDAPNLAGPTADGVIQFRGANAVVLRGPATVRLTFPFRVEQLPINPVNYWEDLRAFRAQLQLPLRDDPDSAPSGLLPCSPA
ncbi:MAG: hypothetical protein AB7J34_17585 [Limisphaerales bacterium]